VLDHPAKGHDEVSMTYAMVAAALLPGIAARSTGYFVFQNNSFQIAIRFEASIP
jgi:hypothetical protein